VARAGRIGILVATLVGGLAACGSDPAPVPEARDADVVTGASQGAGGAPAFNPDMNAPVLRIVQTQQPDETCKLSEEGTSGERRLEGILDVGLDRAYEYRLFPLLANRRSPSSPDAGADAPGGSTVTVTDAVFEVQALPGVTIAWPAGCPPVFVEPFTLILPPGRQAVTSLTALRTCHAAVLRDLFQTGKLDRSLATTISLHVLVRIRAQQGGATIETPRIEFPIRICDGCLQTGFAGPYAQFSRALEPPRTVACDHLVENPYRGNLCNPAQDFGPILCCTASVQGAEKLICPGVPMSKTP
jgi:hypothetical protein